VLYNEFLDELELAAELGFDGVCVNEHHANAYGLMPSPNLMAAALARRTREAALVIMGASLALYNPPIRVAEEFAMIDCISGGRLVAGFPVGTPMDTCYAYGQNPSTLRDRYWEAHDLVVRAWTEEAPFTFHGRWNHLRYVNVWPRPLQKPHPPIWIPGGGSVETWRWCAERDYVYCYLSYFGYRAGAKTMRGYWAEMERLRKERNPYRAGFLQFVGVAETRAEAMKLYREPAEYFYGRCLHLDPRFATPPGYMTEASIRAKAESMVARAARASSSGPDHAMTFDRIVDEGYVIVGNPEEVAAKLREVATELNVGQMMLLCQFGNMSRELAGYNIRLFAERVAPELRGLFDDRWENRWWPKPLGADTRVAPRVLGDSR
jgi:alkanesulfonate monooxygenase SsuD/methylene tetrahydromethanopterin reductase-like flavin-dependent oxidoreductase (luciferase family)